MLNAVSERISEVKIETSANYDDAYSDMVKVEFIKNKILDIFNLDQKQSKPVFLYLPDETISRLAYCLAGKIKHSVAIGIAGETASGKSTFTYDIIQAVLRFQKRNKLNPIITRINADDYYYDRSEMVKAAGSFANFARNYDLDNA
ncbi:MAG: hypothetical protein MZU97_09160 [Bacillus subtilis]|nr:hypothetical protein [Bacillus subtilis]